METHKEIWHVVTWHHDGQVMRKEWSNLTLAMEHVETLHKMGRMHVAMSAEERRCL